MSASTWIALGGLAIAAFGAFWPVRQWLASRRADESKNRVTNREALMERQREWGETLFEQNERLIARVDRLEEDREADRRRITKLQQERRDDHELITGLRDYIRRIVATNPHMKLPPAPAWLDLD